MAIVEVLPSYTIIHFDLPQKHCCKHFCLMGSLFEGCFPEMTYAKYTHFATSNNNPPSQMGKTPPLPQTLLFFVD